MENKTRLWTKDYVFLLLGSVLLYIGFMVFMPTLPARIIELGGTQMQASLAVGLFSIVALLMRAIAGSWNDKFGPKVLIIVGFLILILTTVNFYWSTAVAALLLLRLFHGAGWGIGTTSIATGVSKLVPPSRTGEGIGFYGLTTALGMSLAPIIAILIMNYFSFDVLVTFSLVLMVFILILMTQLKIPKSEKVVHHKMKLFEKTALLPAGLCLLMAIPLGGIQTFMMVYGTELGISTTWVYFIGQAIMVLVSRLFAGRLYDTKGHRFVVIPGALSMIIGILILSFATGAISLFIASLFFGLGYGMSQPALQALAVDRAAPHNKGTANGTFLSGMDIGMAVGSFGLSIVATYYNYATMYRTAIIALIVFFAVYWFTLGRKVKNS
ncbi:MFS transporter [Listeria sp. FSL L7-0229]|uniref:lmo2826 family MFS transporter n=1 Tax=Listeria cossartiae TaxID=2838249 RepID=UPI00162A19C2|nr:lmo2826 family MFS transporter [Listeria cossartiae]MBC2192365.1 MFS transporter [Listeria cossartiae subsp. cossartiae]